MLARLTCQSGKYVGFCLIACRNARYEVDVLLLTSSKKYYVGGISVDLLSANDVYLLIIQ
jgi:hypothetical protein